MEEDERVTYFGEDVSSKEGGVLGLTRGLLEQFGPVRIFNTPISEEAIAANAAGRALAGGKPICEFQFAPFFWDATPLLAHAVASQWYQKKMKYGFIAIFPCGIVHGGASGHFHESWPERFLVPMEGIAVIAPSNAYDVVGLMRAAYEFDGPVAVLLQISAAGLPEFISEVPLEPYVVPIGKAKVVREGSDFTVVTYGAACVAAAKNEADFLVQEGVSVEVIDLRTVHPWDLEMIRSSVQKTGRCVIFHVDYYKRSAGQMLKGELEEDEGFLECLKTPTIKVIGAKYMFTPTALDLVWDRLPYERVQMEKTDKKGRKYKETMHRSHELADVIKDTMKYR